MSWKIKVFLLSIFLIPSFIGYPFSLFDSHTIFSWSKQWAVTGPTDGQVLYFLVVIVAISALCGIRKMLIGLTAGALVSISIVFAGGFVAFLKTKVGIPNSPDEYQYSPYYIARYLNIITVVPLSLVLFITFPFLQFERSIITSSEGVTLKQKIFLMVVRVINNVRYDVLPEIWYVIIEEKEDNFSSYLDDATLGKFAKLKKRMKKLFLKNMYIAAIGIAVSLEYVPLWAVEIAQLPTKQKGGI